MTQNRPDTMPDPSAETWSSVAHDPDGRAPYVIGTFRRDTADRLLNQWDPFNTALLYPGAQFVNAVGAPLPRFSMTDAPAQLDEQTRVQFAREVYDKFNAEHEAIDFAGAAVFDVPGSGPLLLPASADLAEVCLRLGVDVDTTPNPGEADVIIEDPGRPAA